MATAPQRRLAESGTANSPVSGSAATATMPRAPCWTPGCRSVFDHRLDELHEFPASSMNALLLLLSAAAAGRDPYPEGLVEAQDVLRDKLDEASSSAAMRLSISASMLATSSAAPPGPAAAATSVATAAARVRRDVFRRHGVAGSRGGVPRAGIAAASRAGVNADARGDGGGSGGHDGPVDTVCSVGVRARRPIERKKSAKKQNPRVQSTTHVQEKCTAAEKTRERRYFDLLLPQ